MKNDLKIKELQTQNRLPLVATLNPHVVYYNEQIWVKSFAFGSDLIVQLVSFIFNVIFRF